MNSNLNLLIGLAMGLNLLALGSSRLPTLIRAMSVQGVILGAMPVLMEHSLDWRVILVAVATMIGKGLVIPHLLRRAMRTAQIDRELEPLIGFVPSCYWARVGQSPRWHWRGCCRCCRSTRVRCWCPGRWPRCSPGLFC